MNPSSATTLDAPILGHGVHGTGRENVLALHDWMGDAANYAPAGPTPQRGLARLEGR